jgi:hypothetical protein
MRLACFALALMSVDVALNSAPTLREVGQVGTDSEIECSLDAVDESQAIEVSSLEPAVSPSSGWVFRSHSIVRAHHGSFLLLGPQGRLTVLLAQPVNRPWYFLEGPFSWPAPGTTLRVDPVRRRTVTGTVDPGLSQPNGITWLPSDDELFADRALCRIARGTWQCLGAPWTVPGVVIALANESIGSTVIARASRHATERPLVLEPARWGRLVSVESPGKATDIQISAWKTIASRNQRSQRERIEPNTSIRMQSVGAKMWITGLGLASGGFVQIDGSDITTTRIGLDDIASGPPNLPLTIQVRQSVPLKGEVVAPDGRPVPRAVVLVSEIVQSTSSDNQPRLRTIAEVQANNAGRFAVHGLGNQPYEFLVMDSLWGRARIKRTPDGRDLTIHLQRITRVGGRVVRQRVPVVDVPVRLRPDLNELASGTEPLDHVTLETRTGPDGRFTIALPPAGSTELQVGSEALGYVRRRVPAARDAPYDIALGDLELGGAIRLEATLLTSEICDLLAAGPIGSSGMTIVAGTRQPASTFSLVLPESGRWLLTARCHGQELRVDPDFIDVPPDLAELTAQFSVRPQ